MKSKILVCLLLVSLLTSILASAVSIRAADNDNVKLYITPHETIMDVDSFFDVYLDISDVTDLFGFDIKVTWDNTLITRDDAISNATTRTKLNEIWGVGKWFAAKEEYSGGGGGGGVYRLAALSTFAGYIGTHSLFNIRFVIVRHCNFLLETAIHIEAGYKLSNSLWQPIPVVLVTDGVFQRLPTKPDLELVPFDPYPSKPFEYCKIFEVKVYATHICANLKDYDFIFQFDNTLLKFVDVDEWGLLGNNLTGEAHYELLPDGTVHVWDLGGATATGDSVYLFALTFHIEFNDDIVHIWRVNAAHELIATISFLDARLSFLEGPDIPMSEITMPLLPLTVTVYLIRGDVASMNPPQLDGMVDITDLRTVAAFYDQTGPIRYDLTNDTPHYIDIFDLVVIATHFGYNDP